MNPIFRVLLRKWKQKFSLIHIYNACLSSDYVFLLSIERLEAAMEKFSPPSVWIKVMFVAWAIQFLPVV